MPQILAFSSSFLTSKFSIHNVFKTRVLLKIFDAEFPYKRSCFEPLCPPAKMAAEIVKGPINLTLLEPYNKRSFVKLLRCRLHLFPAENVGLKKNKMKNAYKGKGTLQENNAIQGFYCFELIGNMTFCKVLCWSNREYSIYLANTFVCTTASSRNHNDLVKQNHTGLLLFQVDWAYHIL